MDIVFPTDFTSEMQNTVLESEKFSRYLNRIQESFFVKDVTVTGVDWFGSKPGFIHVTSTVFDDIGNKIPGCATLRGDGVGILLVLENINENNKPYTVLVEQGRSPVGDYIKEIPAGCLDKDLNALETAIIELKEEVDADLPVTIADLKELYTGFTSPGGIDESITLVSATLKVTDSYIQALQGKMAGAVTENESIILSVVPLHTLPYVTTDLKSVLAYSLYVANT